MRLAPLPFALSFLFCLPAYAQTIVQVVVADQGLGGGDFTNVFSMAVNDRADFLVYGRLDSKNSDWDEGIVFNGELIHIEVLAPLPEPANAFVDEFISMDLNNSSEMVFTHQLGYYGTSQSNDALYLGDRLVMLDSDTPTAQGLGAGTTYVAFGDVKLLDDRRVLLRARVDDPTVQGIEDVLLALQLSAQGEITSETLIAREPFVHSGGPPNSLTSGIWGWERSAAINAAGDVMWSITEAGSSSTDDAVLLNGIEVLREGSPSPVPGVAWSFSKFPLMALNDRGDWALREELSLLDTDQEHDEIIVKNGAEFVREGDSLPDIAPYVIVSNDSFSAGLSGVDLTAAGDVLWGAHWNQPDSASDTGIFFNERLIVQAGVTQVDGKPLLGVAIGGNGLLSSDLGFVMFVGAQPDFTGGVYVMHPASVGTRFCLATDHSGGDRASISTAGTASISANDLTLVGYPLPANSFALFYYGPDTAQVPFGNGTRCIDGPTLQRLPVGQSTENGAFVQSLDLTDPPTTSGLIAAGSTWHFQCWFRDAAGGGAGFNLSDGISVTFEQ